MYCDSNTAMDMCDANTPVTSSEKKGAVNTSLTASPDPEIQQTGSGYTSSLTSNNVTLQRLECGQSEPGKDKPQQTVPPMFHSPQLSFMKDLKSKHKFSLAFNHQNAVAANAIKSLDSLNDQIVQYIFGHAAASADPTHGSDSDPLPPDLLHLQDRGHDFGRPTSATPSKEQCDDNLKTSIVLIRRLLQDAQSKFRKMVEENKQLALRIDGSIQSANHEVTALRTELAHTNQRLTQINPRALAEDSESEVSASVIHQLRYDNSRLENQVRTLVQEVTSLKSGGSDGQPSYGELKLELIQTRQDHVRYKDVLQAMKSDRKRLKAEKVDLLHQMKQLYVTLEDKESELRDFIRNYEMRVQESDETIKQLAMEKDETEREKWEIIKKAREAAERSMLLRTQLDAREQTIIELQEENARLKDLAERGVDEGRESNNTTPTPADDNGHEADDTTATTTTSNDDCAMSSSSVTTTTSTGSERAGSVCGSCHTPDLSTDESLSGSTLVDNPSLSDHANDSLSSLMKWMTLSSDSNLDSEACKMAAKKKKKSLGSLSKVFTRGRSRRSVALPHNQSLVEDGNGTKLSLLTPDNYQEKLQTVDALKGQHMCQWKAGQVLAWIEINLSMPMYGRNCAINVKSGKVLLGLSDSELSTALGISNHIHRRKLRLAIEEHRDPNSMKFPLAPNLDVTWVAHKLLPDLGLSQYSLVFEKNLVDGRLLNSLSRKDLEKHFDIHRKFHQASILHAVELLRRMDFDREKLQVRRAECEDSDSDLIVWTSQRVVKWVRSIDLGEFADNLQESGVHGALMVLEPSFNTDTLATALAIPPSKSYIRRHLSAELDTLLRPARAALDTPNNNSKHLDPAGKGHNFTRSYRGQTTDDGSKGRLSFRGSLGRAFGKKIRDDLKLAFDTDSPKWKISAPIPIQHTSLLQPALSHPSSLPRSSLDNVVEIPGDSTAV